MNVPIIFVEQLVEAVRGMCDVHDCGIEGNTLYIEFVTDYPKVPTIKLNYYIEYNGRQCLAINLYNTISEVINLKNKALKIVWES